jgi:hypothetical protein
MKAENAMPKTDILAALSPYHQDDIRGLLIELDMPDYYDLYDRVERVVSDFMQEVCTASPLDAWDWDVGEYRFAPKYLIHVWSEDYDLMTMEDFSDFYSEENLKTILTFIRALAEKLRESVADVEGITVLPQAT